MLNIEVNRRLAASTIALAAIAFPLFWYQQLGSAPLNYKVIAVLVLYFIATSGFVAIVLGKFGRQLTSEVTDRKIQKTVSVFVKYFLPFTLVAAALWSCYRLWSVLNAT